MDAPRRSSRLASMKASATSTWEKVGTILSTGQTRSQDQANRRKTEGGPSEAPLPSSSSEEKLYGDGVMELEHKASIVITPGDAKTLITETPGESSLTLAKESDERPSSPATGTTVIKPTKITRNLSSRRTSEPTTVKRKLSPPTPTGLGARRKLFPPNKKHKDGCWTEPPNHLDPLQLSSHDRNPNQTPMELDSEHHHQPAGSLNKPPSQIPNIQTNPAISDPSETISSTS